jgi:ribosome-binding factor A
VTHHRISRLESAIERAVREVLARGLGDPRVRGLVTVTGVRVLPDLSEARVRVSILPAEGAEVAMHGIVSSAGHIRREVGRLIDTRVLPPLRFELDDSLKREAAVLRDIDRAKEDLARREHRPPTPPDSP